MNDFLRADWSRAMVYKCKDHRNCVMIAQLLTDTHHQSYHGNTNNKLSRNKKRSKFTIWPLVRESGFRNQRNFCLRIPESGKLRNPGLWNLEYSLRNPESHLRLETGIQVPLTKSGIQNLESTAWSPESKTISWIAFHGVNYHYILYNTDFASE